jgi:hypothetical protein
MTPLGLRSAAGAGAHLVARPRGVLHAYRGPLTPSGRSVPRAGRAECNVRTRTLGVVSLSTVGRLRVCGRCKARLAANPVCEPGTLPRHEAKALYADVTPFDLAVDAWRCETVADVERLEWVALLTVGLPALRTEPVVAPNGKVSDPLDQLIARARRRIDGVRDYLSPSMRAAADENEHEAREAIRLGKRKGWQDREDRITRLGFNLATRRPA